MSREAKIGFIGIVAIIAFFILVPSSSTRDSTLLHNTYNFIVADGQRLNEGCAVKLAGYSVGKVSAINFTDEEDVNKFGEDAHIIVTVATDAGVNIPEDSTLGFNSSQSGAPYIDIQPGNSETMLRPNCTVRLADGYSSDPAKFAHASQKIAEMMPMIQEFHDSVASEQFQDNIRDLASNMRFYTNEAKIATKNLPAKKAKLYRLLDEKQSMAMQQIDRINLQIDLGAKRIKEIRPRLEAKTGKVKSQIAAVDKKLDGMLQTAKRETERFKNISGKLENKTNDIMKNPEYRAKLRQAATKLDSLAKTTEDIHCVTSEPSVREGLTKLVHQYREQSQAIKEKLERWEGLIPGEASAATPRKPYTAPTPVSLPLGTDPADSDTVDNHSSTAASNNGTASNHASPFASDTSAVPSSTSDIPTAQ